MLAKLGSIENAVNFHIALLLRLAGLASITAGLIGVYWWLQNLADIGDGDDMRWGFLHNPFMQFRLFNESFLLLSMWVLLACSAAAGVGGVMLMIPLKWGALLVTWQARISIIINGVIAFAIVMMTFGFTMMSWEKEALVLRLGSIVVDLMLWAFLRSNAVIGFFAWPRHRRGSAFEVIVKEPAPSS